MEIKSKEYIYKLTDKKIVKLANSINKSPEKGLEMLRKHIQKRMRLTSKELITGPMFEANCSEIESFTIEAMKKLSQ